PARRVRRPAVPVPHRPARARSHRPDLRRGGQFRRPFRPAGTGDPRLPRPHRQPALGTGGTGGDDHRRAGAPMSRPPEHVPAAGGDDTGAQRFPELGCYGLAGHAPSARALLDEVRAAEDLGFGAIFLSERFDTKEAMALAGAAAAISDRIGIGTAATNHNTRHPVVTAAAAVTLHRLTGGRYALGLGRGFDLLFDVLGLPRVTSAQLTDIAGVYRALWRGG